MLYYFINKLRKKFIAKEITSFREGVDTIHCPQAIIMKLLGIFHKMMEMKTSSWEKSLFGAKKGEEELFGRFHWLSIDWRSHWQLRVFLYIDCTLVQLSSFFAKYFSWICLRIKMVFIVRHPGMKPNWISLMSTCCLINFLITVSAIFRIWSVNLSPL